MTCKVSIVVPIYDVEKYLAKCLDSLIGQTLSDIEIILVNDCSPDNSEEIVLDYQKKDSRIVYFKQSKNQGQGIARNVGVNAAKGEYILFVDSDDYLDLNAAEVLYKKAKELNLDVLEANYLKVFPTHQTKQENPVFDYVLNGNEFFEEIAFTYAVVWNKLWRKEFLIKNKLAFNKLSFEDVFFISEAIIVAERVFRIDYPFYYYVVRENSVMTSKVNIKHVKSLIELVKFLEHSYNSNTTLLGSNQRLKIFLYSLSSLASFITRFQPINDEEFKVKQAAKKVLKEKHDKYRSVIFSCNKLGFKQKILLFISPYLMSFVINKIKK